MTALNVGGKRRTRLFVDRRLQGSIVFRILCHWMIFVAAGTLLAVLLRVLTHIMEPATVGIVDLLTALVPFLITMLALLPIYVVDTIKLTNRFAGPFVRFRSEIRRAANGETPGHVKFRAGDYWCETEADLNAVFEELTELRRAVGRSSLASISAEDARSEQPRSSDDRSPIARQAAAEAEPCD